MKFSARIASFSLLACLAACGYRWSHEGGLLAVSVPFVQGDADGSLTAELLHALGREPRVHVVSQGNGCRLDVAIVSQGNETIGYRIDPQQTQGKTQKNIVADEGRRTLVAEVALVDLQTNAPRFGPVRIQADAEYDYVDGDSTTDLTFVDANGTTQTVLAFSLGQLESIEAAQEAAAKPLHRKLCQKIVDCICAQW